MGNLTFSCTSGGNINWWNLLEQPFGSINLKKHSYPLTQHFHCLEFIPREHAYKSTGPADGGIVYTSKNWKPPKYPSIGDELNNSHSAAQWNPYCSTWISNRHLKLSMPWENLFLGPHQTAPPTSSPQWEPASSPPSCLGQTLHTLWSPLSLLLMSHWWLSWHSYHWSASQHLPNPMAFQMDCPVSTLFPLQLFLKRVARVIIFKWFKN